MSLFFRGAQGHLSQVREKKYVREFMKRIFYLGSHVKAGRGWASTNRRTYGRQSGVPLVSTPTQAMAPGFHSPLLGSCSCLEPQQIAMRDNRYPAGFRHCPRPSTGHKLQRQFSDHNQPGWRAWIVSLAPTLTPSSTRPSQSLLSAGVRTQLIHIPLSHGSCDEAAAGPWEV